MKKATTCTEAPKNSIENYIKDIFSISNHPKLAEIKLDEKISTITKNFLQDDSVCTDIDLVSITHQFSNSQIPAEPSEITSYIDDLVTNVIDHSIHTSSPRFIGHMTSALPYFVRPLGKLMTAINQNVVKTETSKSFTPFERHSLALMHRLIYQFSEEFYQFHIQNYESTLGIIATGGTLANITALWCARNFSLGQKDNFTGIENEGLPAALKFYGYEGAVIIGSERMHYSFEKAAGLLGIGERSLIKVPVDSKNRIDLSKLQQTIAECRTAKKHIIAIVGIAGATDCGAVDPLLDMAEIAQNANIHLHVDAAWGGPVLFSEQHRHKLVGIERADSVTIDGHKQLYLPAGIGMVLLRNPQIAKVIEKYAAYTVRKESIDLGKRSLEGSRPGMVLFLGAALNLIGQKGYEFLIDEGIRKTQYMANLILNQPEFELLLEPEINILLYRYIPKHWRQKVATGELTKADNQLINQFNEHLQNLQRQAGLTFVSRTTLEVAGIPIVALRAVIANPLTTEVDIDAVLDEQIKIAASISVLEEER
ncbi:MAG: putative pyridoxal-dependent aspartate 1-decarboxylase [Desmonostoc vinosum HA7617-LM4]|jgi:glutamate decarboxylase|nr:putative pyridoxal-dependent aspartate 1-decarboxylase [Desmonostoc vinosum HA7617-LM4]